ncbi:hypothetical protein [Bordetella pertussis]|uniref:hypothetical protein n=1 Tax=Bordetella pertussis TaxID=520 RepID=UPI000417F023
MASRRQRLHGLAARHAGTHIAQGLDQQLAQRARRPVTGRLLQGAVHAEARFGAQGHEVEDEWQFARDALSPPRRAAAQPQRRPGACRAGSRGKRQPCPPAIGQAGGCHGDDAP